MTEKQLPTKGKILLEPYLANTFPSFKKYGSKQFTRKVFL
uniref:Uncharacterized protein n=1 Tax=Anguilla anguilla TaxID=7936 RepID=A0A0E9SNN0_ANGAN